MDNLTIRAIKAEDAAQINAIRTMEGVRENTLGIFSERISSSAAFIN